MKVLAIVPTGLPDFESGERLLSRMLRKRDVPEPVAAWRAMPEAAFATLTADERRAYIAALLPLIRIGRRIDRRRLRRLYQLFTFLELPRAARLETLAALHMKLKLEPPELPAFENREVRQSLMTEATVLAGRSPTREVKDYLTRLQGHLGVKSSETSR